MEFGAKFDLSLDTEGYGRIERISFDPYNEGATLQEAVERFKKRTGHYPERVLADQIYRTRDNRRYCKRTWDTPVGSPPGEAGRCALRQNILY